MDFDNFYALKDILYIEMDRWQFCKPPLLCCKMGWLVFLGPPIGHFRKPRLASITERSQFLLFPSTKSCLFSPVFSSSMQQIRPFFARSCHSGSRDPHCYDFRPYWCQPFSNWLF